MMTEADLGYKDYTATSEVNEIASAY